MNICKGRTLYRTNYWWCFVWESGMEVWVHIDSSFLYELMCSRAIFWFLAIFSGVYAVIFFLQVIIPLLFRKTDSPSDYSPRLSELLLETEVTPLLIGIVRLFPFYCIMTFLRTNYDHRQRNSSILSGSSHIQALY